MNFEGRFSDRKQAGAKLALRLTKYSRGSDVVVLGLPRGGVPVASEVARRLDFELDVMVVRKLGMPRHEELAMGAIASGGFRVLNWIVVDQCGVSKADIETVTRREEKELLRRERAYRGDRPPLTVEGRTVILVDDGLATGTTMRAAVQALRALGAARLIVAVPVGSAEACRDIRPEVDELVCLLQPRDLIAISLWYADFQQITDDEVRALLRSSLPAMGGLGKRRPTAGTVATE